ncbi:Cold shock protein, CspA family [Bradyrhizobium erythrophlei]|nr:Cold shock protein, CspA family [Bradyrhizobium erythrophlei]
MPKGTVLFWKDNEAPKRGGFGFISPDDTPDKRETNVWFGSKALNGLTVRQRDRVDFDFGNYRPGKGPSAAHVRLIEDDREEITTLAGEFET